MTFANLFETTDKTAPRLKATTASKARLVGLVALAFATAPALAAPVAEEGGASSLRGLVAHDDEGASPAPQDIVPLEGDSASPDPQHLRLQDVPPPDDEAAPVAGQAGPLLNRRLQDPYMDVEGWMVQDGVRLNSDLVRQKGGFVSNPWPGAYTTLSECKRTCLSYTACLSIDFSGGDCFLSTVAGGSELMKSIAYRHYVPTRQAFSEAIVELGQARAEQAARVCANLAGDNADWQAICGESGIYEQVAMALAQYFVSAMQDMCDGSAVSNDATRYSHLGDGRDAFLPHCDVSGRGRFDYMFIHARGIPDISGWDVSSGRNFAHMFYQAQSFSQDLSGWRIHRSQSGRADVTNMFSGSGMDNIEHCPCIHYTQTTWKRFCPGKEHREGMNMRDCDESM